MAHWRDGGIGNMPGSDDRPYGEWTLLEQLAAAADGKVCGVSPDDLAQAAFDEIQRLNILVDTATTMMNAVSDVLEAEIKRAKG